MSPVCYGVSPVCYGGVLFYIKKEVGKLDLDYSPFQHGVYIMRWAALAVPGAWFLVQVQKRIKGTYAAMVVSQAILGAIVFWIDRLIFNKF